MYLYNIVNFFLTGSCNFKIPLVEIIYNITFITYFKYNLFAL